MPNHSGNPRVWYARLLRELYRMLVNAGSVQYAVPMPPPEEPAAPRPAPVREPVPVG